MLCVFSAFGKRPNFVAAVVVPLARSAWFQRRQILSFVSLVDEQIAVRPESNLYQASAKPRHNCQRYPVVANLLRAPSFVVHGMNCALFFPRARRQQTKHQQARASGGTGDRRNLLQLFLLSTRNGLRTATDPSSAPCAHLPFTTATALRKPGALVTQLPRNAQARFLQ